MLKKILAVSGKPGLYQLVSKGSNCLIIESLTDKKRMPAYARDKVISLGDISIYTDEGEVSIRNVFTSIKEKEGGKNPSIDLSKAQPDDLRKYFAEILPEFDRERVYPSDIRKMIKWYEILTAAGITDFAEEKEETEASAAEENKSEEKEEKKAGTKKVASSSKTKASTTKRKEAPKTIGSTKAKVSAKASAPKKTVAGGKRGGSSAKG